MRNESRKGDTRTGLVGHDGQPLESRAARFRRRIRETKTRVKAVVVMAMATLAALAAVITNYDKVTQWFLRERVETSLGSPNERREELISILYESDAAGAKFNFRTRSEALVEFLAMEKRKQQHNRANGGEVVPVNLKEACLDNIDVEGVDFDNVNMYGASLKGARFADCRFRNCYIYMNEAKGAEFRFSSFLDCDVPSEAKYLHCALINTRLELARSHIGPNTRFSIPRDVAADLPTEDVDCLQYLAATIARDAMPDELVERSWKMEKWGEHVVLSKSELQRIVTRVKPLLRQGG